MGCFKKRAETVDHRHVGGGNIRSFIKYHVCDINVPAHICRSVTLMPFLNFNRFCIFNIIYAQILVF